MDTLYETSNKISVTRAAARPARFVGNNNDLPTACLKWKKKINIGRITWRHHDVPVNPRVRANDIFNSVTSNLVSTHITANIYPSTRSTDYGLRSFSGVKYVCNGDRYPFYEDRRGEASRFEKRWKNGRNYTGLSCLRRERKYGAFFFRPRKNNLTPSRVHQSSPLRHPHQGGWAKVVLHNFQRDSRSRF